MIQPVQPTIKGSATNTLGAVVTPAAVSLVLPVAPAAGPIAAPAGSYVATLVLNVWDSPTIKAVRNTVFTALVAVLGVFATACMGVWTQGKSILEAGALNLKATEVSAEVAAGLILGSAIIGFVSKNDNTVVKQ